jgi:acyl-coenzyme A synthetase/AMP-(fatty) acid ligase
LVTTPVHLRALVETVEAIPEVVNIYSAGAPLPKHVAERAERQYGATVIECYGCTEAGSIAIREPVRHERWRPLSDYDLVPHENGHAVRAPFFPNPIPLPDTIDLAADGTFSLTGRMGDVINIAGKRASLSGLNAILTSIDGVHDGAFYAPPAAPSDQIVRLTAFVVAPDLTEAEVRRRLRGRIDSSFLPRHVIHLSALPRRDNGKLEYESLLSLARQHVRGSGAGG